MRALSAGVHGGLRGLVPDQGELRQASRTNLGLFTLLHPESGTEAAGGIDVVKPRNSLPNTTRLSIHMNIVHHAPRYCLVSHVGAGLAPTSPIADASVTVKERP